MDVLSYCCWNDMLSDKFTPVSKKFFTLSKICIFAVVPVSYTHLKCDPFDNVKYDPVEWQKYANSLRMRLAMRLSNIDKATAQAEFEDAAKGNKILT